ncbi:hypothetical protein V1478_010873 [Vespula squamosa]|uniref:Uncharacterized protein n=1 Tax=Vespula squamosa TaxID=30214 RepID=A0ABD2AFK8_VESSQ
MSWRRIHLLYLSGFEHLLLLTDDAKIFWHLGSESRTSQFQNNYFITIVTSYTSALCIVGSNQKFIIFYINAETTLKHTCRVSLVHISVILSTTNLNETIELAGTARDLSYKKKIIADKIEKKGTLFAVLLLTHQ